jgi:hypothetical protein
VEVDAAEIQGLDSVKVDAAKPARSRNSRLGFRGSGCGKAGVEVDAAEIRSLDSVEVDAEKPAWRSMRRNCAQNSRLGFIASGCDKAGVKFSRTSNRGPQIFWASRINQHSLCTPKCLNSCIEILNVLNGIGAEAFNGQLTEIWKLGSDGIDGSKCRTERLVSSGRRRIALSNRVDYTKYMRIRSGR